MMVAPTNQAVGSCESLPSLVRKSIESDPIDSTMTRGDADMVQRFKTDAELNTPDQDTFYGGDEKGYIDYPTLA